MKKLAFLLFYIPIFGFSQERTILFGKIFDDLGVKENVHIININSNQATSSNPQGEFKIFAKTKDSIRITYVGYKTKIIILQTSDFGIAEKHIRLKKEVIELEEVNLKKNNLLGTLSSDVKNVKTKKEINAKTLRLPNAGIRKLTVAERRLFTAYGGGVLNIDVIINLLSGRIKKLKKLKQIENNEKEITHLKNTFKNYLIQDLKIDSTNVSRFIYFCHENEDYKKINSKNEFAIIEYLRDKSIEFNKLNKKE